LSKRRCKEFIRCIEQLPADLDVPKEAHQPDLFKIIKDDQNAAESNHVTALDKQNIADDDDFSVIGGKWNVLELRE